MNQNKQKASPANQNEQMPHQFGISQLKRHFLTCIDTMKSLIRMA